jgi:hypothetical protein
VCVTDNTLSEDEIILQAVGAFGSEEVISHPNNRLLDALESFYMNGLQDEVSGDAETYGHFYRVHRWIVWTDSQGFSEVETHDNERDACKAFEKHDKDYSATLDVDECF